MIIIDLMLVVLFIITITLLSGRKIISNPRWIHTILTICAIYSPLSKLIEGYKLGYTGIGSIVAFIAVMIVIFIRGYIKNTYRYTVHNVEEKDIRNIIEGYLKRENISYNLRNKDIYLLDTDNSIYIHSLIETTLDFREIKNKDFYKEIVSEVKTKIKNIEKKYRSIEGLIYLIFTLFLLWIRFTFLYILR